MSTAVGTNSTEKTQEKPDPTGLSWLTLIGLVFALISLGCLLLVLGYESIGLVVISCGLGGFAFMSLSMIIISQHVKKLEPWEQVFKLLTRSERQALADKTLKGAAEAIFEAQRLGNRESELIRITLYEESARLMKDVNLKVPSNFYYWRDSIE